MVLNGRFGDLELLRDFLVRVTLPNALEHLALADRHRSGPGRIHCPHVCALGNASAADDWTRALLVAQSRLALAAATVPLREASDGGTEPDGRIAWRTAVTPYVPAEADPEFDRTTQAMPTRLYRVTVDVQFPGANGQPRTLSLSTLKLGLRNPA